MSRIPDPVLRLQWQRRLLKFQAFHGSVRQFCLDEGVSVASFYQWRAKLDVDRNSTKNKIQSAAGRSDAARSTNTNTNANAARNTDAARFVPLQLVQQAACHTPTIHLVVLLAGGTRIELPCDDSPSLHAVIRSVMLEDAKLQRDHQTCAINEAGNGAGGTR